MFPTRILGPKVFKRLNLRSSTLATPLPLLRSHGGASSENGLKKKTTPSKLQTEATEEQQAKPPPPVASIGSLTTLPESKRLEKFIPVTRRTLLQALVKDTELLDSHQKKLMEKVAAALDAKYSKRFYSILEEAKALYDGMDPDKDTYRARFLSKKELLDNEYYLLQKVERLLDKANFFEIPREKLLTELLHDKDRGGIIISVDPEDYELLRIWTRGQELKKVSLYTRMKEYLASLKVNGPRTYPISLPTTYYTRVCVAVRSKGEKTLHLKVFKDIREGELEHLLPKGKIKMSPFDKGTLGFSILLGVCMPFLRVLPVLNDNWVWGGLGLAAIIAGRAWISYKSKRNHYLANLATTLYFKTVANNRGVLTLLTDRAQDEEFKEALLAYSFLLCPSRSSSFPDLQAYDTPNSLKLRIEVWLEKNFSLKDFSFDISDALNKLDELGLLVRRKNGTLTTLGVEEALAILPAPTGQWSAVGVRRDTQSLDEQMGRQEEEERTSSKKRFFMPGWS